MIFISLALPCLKRFINTSVKYVYVWHPRLWYHSQRPRPALADGAAFETVNRAACFKRFKQCFKSFCLKLFLCVSILAEGLKAIDFYGDINGSYRLHLLYGPFNANLHSKTEEISDKTFRFTARTGGFYLVYFRRISADRVKIPSGYAAAFGLWFQLCCFFTLPYLTLDRAHADAHSRTHR